MLPLALVAAGLFTAHAVSAQSFTVPTSGVRAERWEVYGGLRPIFSESVDFEGGTTFDTDDDLGFAFGFGYNFNEHWLVAGEFSWSTVDYDGVLVSADNPGQTASLSGEFDAGSIAATATYHLLEGPLTPYASATLGYTWIDSNIATGPPEVGCWWDPWWGYVCDTFVDTADEDTYSYGLGIGVRWDFNREWFARLSYDERWLDLDQATSTPTFGTLHIDVGGKF